MAIFFQCRMFHSVVVQYTNIVHLFACNTDLQNSEPVQVYTEQNDTFFYLCFSLKRFNLINIECIKGRIFVLARSLHLVRIV